MKFSPKAELSVCDWMSRAFFGLCCVLICASRAGVKLTSEVMFLWKELGAAEKLSAVRGAERVCSVLCRKAQRMEAEERRLREHSHGE